jgi:SAM-dependent methyltransferase
MNNPKAFYYNYLADDKLGGLNHKLIELINAEAPVHVFEFGCGTGKNLRALNCVTCGMDISPANIMAAHYGNRLPFLILGNEYHLGHLGRFDVAFTCSVLDHIEDIDRIIKELKRIGKTIFLAETNTVPAPFYYPHDYESYGFQKIPDFTWTGDDGAYYFIWKWSATFEITPPRVNDDIA